MLRPDDTLHFFTSPYRRTRETTEGILRSLTAADPATGAPSPYPRDSIKVYEEPRLREQDFGNFQPCSAEMERMWQERADYGHFFYRIPNGESAADAYDRVSGFNETLWRLFGEDDYASVCVLVTHGLMARIFLMKWYHFSVEHFEDLRNINHCEFVVMEQNADSGKYALQTQLRTWSQLKKEWAEEMQQSKALDSADTSPVTAVDSVQACRKWGGCPDGCDHARYKFKRRKPVRKNTRDMLYEYDQREREKQFALSYGSVSESELSSSSAQGPQPEASVQDAGDTTDEEVMRNNNYNYNENETNSKKKAAKDTPTSISSSAKAVDKITRGLAIYSIAGRDGGGSQSGAESHVESGRENANTTTRRVKRRTKQRQQQFIPKDKSQGKSSKTVVESPGLRPENQGRGVADSLGDRDDDENEDDSSSYAMCQHSPEIDVSVGEDDSSDDGQAKTAHEKAKRHDQSIRESVY